MGGLSLDASKRSLENQTDDTTPRAYVQRFQLLKTIVTEGLITSGEES